MIIVLFGVVAMVLVILVFSFINNIYQLNREKPLLNPIGELVTVKGHQMSIYIEGTGEKTLVFLSGGGTSSPILDFKSLYSLLSDKYRIVIVEKFGYGFSNIVDDKRDIDTISLEIRESLKEANIKGPLILVPHSMSGIEAIYWAQNYPDEIEAIIGLDMAVPEAYKDLPINQFSFNLIQFANNVGLTRFFGIDEVDAIKYGALTDKEKQIYKAVFHTKLMDTTMINETREIKNNALKVGSGYVPQVPILMFMSNGTGTGYDEATWKSFQKQYLKNFKSASFFEYDYPHYIHNFMYRDISTEMEIFIDDLR